VKLHIIAAALTFSMVACQLSTGGEIGSVVVRTDGSTFVLDDGVAGVPFTIENRRGAAGAGGAGGHRRI
jgi:hypothetical protein